MSESTRDEEARNVALASVILAYYNMPLAKLEGWERRAAAVVAENHTKLALVVSNAALGAYDSGELDLLQTLNVVNSCALFCSPEASMLIVGATAIRALTLGRPKYLGRSRPIYPTWLKQVAVDLVVTIQSILPDLPLTKAPGTPVNGGSALEVATILLHAFRLCPPLEFAGPKASNPRSLLSTLTLHHWYLERMRTLGKSVPRGRPRKKK
jgi:hypothetical protein